jgi:hypothetical protein
MFHVDVAKVDQNVTSVSETCCKHLFKTFHLFSDICMQAFFDWMLHMFHTCWKSMFQWSRLFQSYVAVSVLCCKLQVFYLDIAYVSHTYFKYMFQMFCLFRLCCIQLFYISEVCSGSHWGTTRAW